MLIGKADEDKLIPRINKLEDELGREINYHIYTAAEFINKWHNKNDFINEILNGPKILLKGTIDELTGTN